MIKLNLRLKGEILIMKKTVIDFCNTYKEKRFMNTSQGTSEKSEWLRKELEIKTYIPFREKRTIAEMIVNRNIKEINGVKKYDSIDGYVSLVVASIAAHTNLEWSADPVSDYDILAESGLLHQIIEEFKSSHDEIDILLKMAVASELEDNNINVLVGRFLDGILKRLDGFGEAVKTQLSDINIQDLLGSNFKEEDLAKLSSFLDKIK